MNVVFHAANAVLLFLVLKRMTRATWRSAVVAALFAWHPLRVESVAWISERKDVLCGFFFLLTLWAWVRYAQGMTSGKWQVTGPEKPFTRFSDTSHVSRFTLLLAGAGFFRAGVDEQADAVTLPFVLLLLDVWPLKRISEFGVRSSESKHAGAPQLSTLNSQPCC